MIRTSRNLSTLEDAFSNYDFLGGDFARYQPPDLSSQHLMRLIPGCFGSSALYTSDCSMFDPLPTSSGVCHSFNSAGVDAYADSDFVRIFRRVYGVEDRSGGLRMIDGDGDKFGVSFYLDGNTRARPTYDAARQVPMPRSSFSVSLGSASQAVDPSKNVVQIQPGRHTVIKVKRIWAHTKKNLSIKKIVPQKSYIFFRCCRLAYPPPPACARLLCRGAAAASPTRPRASPSSRPTARRAATLSGWSTIQERCYYRLY